jgi:DHA1 family bicyclomycin/chloramphenicol resistance-like MFS transporter
MAAPARLPSVLFLAAATALGPFGLHILIPSMPGLVESFATDYGTVQLTLTLYLAGTAVAQLGYGPLSDRFGRRPVMLAGLVFYVAASALCALAWSIEALIAGRVLQSIGGCAGMVLGRAIIRDVLDRDRGASMIASVTMAMALAPAFAPIAGGYVDLWLGWRAIFVGLALIGAAVGAAAFLLLNETNLQPLARLDLAGTFQHYGQLMGSRVFLGYALSTAVTMSTYFAFLAGTPYIMVELMGQTIDAYGPWFVLIVVAYMLGNYVATRLSVRLGGDRMMRLGIGLSLLAMAGMVAVERLGPPHPIVLFGPMAIFVIGNGISQPNGISAAIGVRPDIAGAASGLMGFLQMAVSAAATLLVGHLLDRSALPMVLVMAATAVLAAAFFAMARSGQR